MKILSLLPWIDWLAMGLFFGLWIGYAWFARVNGTRNMTLIATTNHYRQLWMLQATAREPRMLDGLITQNLSQTPAFFSSTSIIIMGGLFALLGTTDKAVDLVREIPFAVQTPMLVFELKILVLVGIFVYAFFRFSWSMRQYTFVALVIGASYATKKLPLLKIQQLCKKINFPDKKSIFPVSFIYKSIAFLDALKCSGRLSFVIGMYLIPDVVPDVIAK